MQIAHLQVAKMLCPCVIMLCKESTTERTDGKEKYQLNSLFLFFLFLKFLKECNPFPEFIMLGLDSFLHFVCVQLFLHYKYAHLLINNTI